MANSSDWPPNSLESASLDLLQGRLAHVQLRRPWSRWLSPLLARFLRIRRDGRVLCLQPVGTALTATVNEHDQGSFLRAVAGGSVSLTQSYARAEWESPDLYQLSMVLFRAEQMANLWRLGALPVEALRAQRRIRRLPQDYGNVAQHYDLPRVLFEATLKGEPYSAVFARLNPRSLEVARSRTYRSLLDSVALERTATLLDLGAGWGALARYVLTETDSRVHAITMSEVQAGLLNEQLGESYPTRLTVVQGDFRDARNWPAATGAIFMLESIEHVHPSDRARLMRDLAAHFPQAPLVIQFSGRSAQRFAFRAGRSGATADLIFPGPAELPTVRQVHRLVQSAGYRVHEMYDLTAEYHQIVLTWLHNFRTAAPEVQAQVPVQVVRAWEMYLAGLAAALVWRTVINHCCVCLRG
jgi:cyclopropane-fatty-acyl-phospholipid synthase